MNWITSIYDREPALLYGLVQAVLVLVVTFGLRLPIEQSAVTAIIIAFLTRQKVTPARG